MLTFEDQTVMYQQITGDYSAAGLIIAKRDINEGGTMFLNRLGRKFNKKYKRADLEADRQYYQFPADVVRISAIRCLHGTFWYTPELVTSEEEWNNLNATAITGNYPTHYFIRGFNEVGLLPIPSANVAGGLEVSHEPQQIEFTANDFTTGTITVANDSVSITHSGTSFTPQMVGRWLQVTDGTDGRWYRIAAYVSTSELELENFYEGISGSTRSFRIGQVMDIPPAYQDAPVYYAVERFYLMQNDQKTAVQFGARFDAKVKSAKETYGRSTSRMGVKTRPNTRRARWIDLTPPVIYP
jgi:hypothetical protein